MTQLILSSEAEKFLTKIQKRDLHLFQQFLEALVKISEDPYCSKTLTGRFKDYRSYRLRSYRVIYAIEEDKARVFVVNIKHRKDVYRK